MSLTEWLCILGYLCLVVCYTPQWIRIWRTHSVAGLDPYFLGLVTIGLAMLQAALILVKERDVVWPIILSNGVALLNVLVLDAFYAWAVL
ncbi:MAG: hypothetical protein K9K66_19235 [Desulfarculaceae bacterium]|nr:hypothetical protein [Desulfarculaceae bacterium]